MPQLRALNEHDDFGVRYFSGVASYTTRFDRPVRKDRPPWLDQGRIGDVAQVFVNGRLARSSWWAPNRLEIGTYLVDGSNTLEVRVANLLVNRLIGDQQSGVTKVTFTAAPTYRSDTHPRQAGLFGPIVLLVDGR